MIGPVKLNSCPELGSFTARAANIEDASPIEYTASNGKCQFIFLYRLPIVVDFHESSNLCWC